MQLINLGRTALRVSRLCLGTMNFGWKTSVADSHAIMDKALELEINFFDTADVYGWEKGPGWTEEILGQWFAQGGERRDAVVLATKVYGQTDKGANDRGLSAWHIVRACEASLRRMQTDRIDLYQMHHVDRSAPWEEIWQAMETLVAQGKVLYVGSSNFAGWQIATANQEARRRNFLGLISEQSLYNLAQRTVELEVLPACRAYGLGVIPWSPLGGGMLAGPLAKAAGSRHETDRVQKALAEHAQQVSRYEALCREVDRSPAMVALAWLLAQDGVAAPIIGPRTMEQLTGSLEAFDVPMDAELLRRLDEIWPGPGGPAPEAYAW